MYRIRGHVRMLIGPEYNMQEFEVGPGDFVFIPQGEIHSPMNLSETEPTELVTCYIGVSSKEEARTIFVEPPLE
jgi:mannose-6-phosphate isomerase-like protein (cupin superfamily)